MMNETQRKVKGTKTYDASVTAAGIRPSSNWDFLASLSLQKTCQIARQIMHMLGQFAPLAHLRLRGMVDVIGMDKDCRHAEARSWFEIMRHIFKHRGVRA